MPTFSKYQTQNQNQESLQVPEELNTWGEEQQTEEAPPMSPPDIVNWFLSFPSVPLSMRKRFFSFWEMIPLGNYTEKDIKKLELWFRGWMLDVLMATPDEEWNSVFKFKKEGINEEAMEMDLNSLFSLLHTIFYVQLTRGRGGFTAKLMAGHPLNTEKEEKKWKFSLF